MKQQLNLPIGFEASEQDLENISNNLVFVSKKIERFEINKEKNNITFFLEENADCEQLEKELSEVLLQLKPAIPGDHTQVYFDNLHESPPCKDDIFSQLKERGDITELEPGYFTLSGPLFDLIRALDNSFVELAKKMGAQEIEYPVTVALKSLKKVDFFKQTPQFANFIGTLKEEKANLSKFSESFSSDDPDLNFVSHINTPTHMCRSAICLNSYPSYENRVFQDDEKLTITSVGKVFRNESKNVASLERLYEFTMREIIFMGSSEHVEKSLKHCLEWNKAFMQKNGLQGVIQTANDPFFADNFKSLQFYQQSQRCKYEVRLINPFTGNQVSCASLNNHKTHFAKSYNLTFPDNSNLTTGCIGWGLERLAFMILGQYGLDPAGWPTGIQELID